MTRGTVCKTLRRRGPEPADGGLSLDDLDVRMLQMIVEGSCPSDIAEVIFLSPDAQKSRRRRIHRFLGTWTLPMLVAECMRQGVVE